VKFGSLFSGIGGFDLGFERAGMECAWQVEIDKRCQDVLSKHWPNTKRYSDVKECGKYNLEPVNLICGGFPCQDVSLAGKRTGLGGKRSTLWSEFYRIICELRPEWVVIENVPGLLSVNDGEFFRRILRELAKSGYDAEWQVIPASAIGAPHKRERIWIVAYTRNNGLEKAEQNTENTKKSIRPIGLWPGIEGCSNTMAYTNSPRLAQRKSIFGYDGEKQPTIIRSDWWASEPNVGRVADGVPFRVDRLKQLGNAIVPQLAEWIGKRIMEQMT